jgi:hypothetical protein
LKFLLAFERGDIAESLDFIEWAGELKTIQMLKDQKEALLGVRLS